MRKRFKPHMLSSAAIAAAFLFPAGIASAQESDEGAAEQSSGREINTIIVTAQKRQESLQDVSIAISAFGSEELIATGTQKISDLSLKIPSLNFSSPNGVVWTFLRGAGNDNPTAGGDNGVAFHYDGVYMGFASAALADIWDVDRVEVLRGPQGTLYGRNSTGGSINVIAKQPTSEFEASGDVTVGNYNLIRTRGVVNLPVSDSVKLRVSGSYTDRDGYLTNLDPDGTQELDDNNSYFLRAGALFELSPDTEFLLTFTGSWQDAASSSPQRLGTAIPAGWQRIFTMLGQPIANRPEDPRVVSKNTPERAINDTLGVSGVLSHDFGNVSLKATGAYYDMSISTRSDWDATSLDINDFFVADEVEQKSFEINLSSNGDNAFNWLVGAYYFDMTDTRVSDVQFFRDTPGGGGFAETNSVLNVNNYAIFSQIDYRLTEDLKLTAGLRYSWDEKDADIESIVPAPSNAPPPVQVGQVPIAGTVDVEGDTPMGRVALDWNVTDDNLIYASVSRGYKAPAIQSQTLDPPTGEEIVWSYEIGAKNSFFDRQLILNVAAFIAETSNVQAQLFGPTSITPIVTDVGDATAWGVEIDYVASLTDQLRISGSAGYLNTEYKGLGFPAFVDVALVAAAPPGTNPSTFATDIAGNSMVNAPKWSISTGATYTIDTDFGTFAPRVDWSYRSRTYFTIFERNDQSQAPFHKVDARVTYTSLDERWTLEAFVQNIGNKDVIHTLLAPPGFLGGDVPAVYYQPPRTYGVRFGFNF